MKTRHVSKVIDVFQRACSCILDTWKKKHKVLITSLSLHWAIYWHKPVYISEGQGSSSSEHAKCTFIIYYYICLPLCAHILYFNAAKFSIKQFSLIYLTVSVDRQRDDYETEIEMWPIKGIQYLVSMVHHSSYFQDVNLHKNPDNRAVVWWNQIHIR